MYVYTRTLIQGSIILYNLDWISLVSLSMSGDGSTFVVGSPDPATTGHNIANPGHVRAFKLSLSINIYTQFGLDIGVLPSYGIFGISVSISQDGTTFAVGAAIKGPYSYTKDNMTILTDNFPAGHIRVFKEVSTLSSYAQVGSDIYGERYLDIFGS